MTPEAVAEQMLRQIQRPTQEWYILDPACGDGNLLLAAAKAMKQVGVSNIASRLIGIDIDPLMIGRARARLRGVFERVENEPKLICGDFLSLSDNSLFKPLINLKFNTVVSNPPYGRSREYQFFEQVARFSPPGTEMIFLMPLAFLDRVDGVTAIPMHGRPMNVTTGHAIVYHISDKRFKINKVNGLQANTRSFKVLSGIKIYEVGGGTPPQTKAIVTSKPFSSEVPRDNWLPCLRTGDIHPFTIRLGRWWVDYGPHLAHPKELARFCGPRLFVRRMPIWETRQLGASYIEETALCAGDVLVIKHDLDDQSLLKGLCVYLNTPEAAESILRKRPSVRYRMSFPKISAKDLNYLLEHEAPSEDALRSLANTYEALKK